jgi:hypothetical protein
MLKVSDKNKISLMGCEIFHASPVTPTPYRREHLPSHNALGQGRTMAMAGER